MRPKITVPAALAVSALGVAAPAHASDRVAFRLSDASLVAGQSVVARGSVDPALAGQRIVLEYRADWRRAELAVAAVAPGGSFRLRGRPPRSGAASVTVAGRRSLERAVGVRARVAIAGRRLHVTAGRSVTVSGAVRPAVARLPVALQIRRAGRWATIDTGRTGTRGAFRVSDRRRSPMSAVARVRVLGARAGVGSAARSLGRLDVYRYANASWYGPGLYGNRLGCGGRLSPGTLGVAHKSLPCGTLVSFRHGSRTVRVPVVDRGPYVGGREYDLTAATAQRLAFSGHGTVLATR